jgi:hypothetical protein
VARVPRLIDAEPAAARKGQPRPEAVALVLHRFTSNPVFLISAMNAARSSHIKKDS